MSKKPKNSSIHTIFSTDIAALRIWRTWLLPSNDCRFLPPPSPSTNLVGTDRNVPPAIRISRRADTLFPILRDDAGARALYRETVDLLFAEYRHFSEEMFRYLRDRTPKPDEMKQDAYERTLRARAFDLSRYLLPLATNTSLGQIVSARTLETQVSRLLSAHARRGPAAGRVAEASCARCLHTT